MCQILLEHSQLGMFYHPDPVHKDASRESVTRSEYRKRKGIHPRPTCTTKSFVAVRGKELQGGRSPRLGLSMLSVESKE